MALPQAALSWLAVPSNAFMVASGGALAVTLGLGRVRPFTISPQDGSFRKIQQLCTIVERETLATGFTAFALAAATTESGGNINAANTSATESAAACKIYERTATSYFGDSPYPASDYCWGSGGWWGMMPGSAMSASGFRNKSPRLIFDPFASTVLFADFLRRITLYDSWKAMPYGDQNWLALRRGMAAVTLASDRDESEQRSKDVRGRLEKSMIARGIDPAAMYVHAGFPKWPGATTLYQKVLQQGSTV